MHTPASLPQDFNLYFVLPTNQSAPKLSIVVASSAILAKSQDNKEGQIIVAGFMMRQWCIMLV
jgi:hypothetical protein